MHKQSSFFRSLFRRFPAIIACLTLLLTPTAPANEDGVIEEVLTRGKLRVGLSSFVPWAMRAKDGTFIGFEIDVATAVAEDMGVELEIIPTAWDGLIPALLTKKIDIIIAGMSITPARNLQVNFTVPYSTSGLGLVANRELAAEMKTAADFNRPDVVFALRRGTAPVNYVRKHMPQAELRQFDDEASAKQEVINGRAHAWISAEPAPTFTAIDFADKLFQPIAGPFDHAHEGFALRKGDGDALNFFNNWIGGRQSWLQERHDYWFKSRAWQNQVGE